MILVESIKYFEVPGDVHEIVKKISAYEAVEVFTKDGAHIISANLLHEVVHGRRFRRPRDGEEIVIGWTKEVQDLLGMPVEAWENAEAYRVDLINREHKVSSELIIIKHANFWQRFKWLFTGVK